MQNRRHREHVLDRRVGREGDGVALDILDFDAVGIVLPRDMQRPDMKADERRDDERQQIVQREKPVQRRAADRETAP